jgi:(2Fe-2S) ferredoxin
MTLLLCGSNRQLDEFKKILDRKDVDYVVSHCEGLDESLPVMIRFPGAVFYGRVPEERIMDVVKGHADDLKIQTARLYDVEMEKYFSEPIYRKTVQLFLHEFEDLDEFTPKKVKKLVNNFIEEHILKEHLSLEAIKMALIKTTRGPELDDLLLCFGQKESIKRLEQYLIDYKHRV